MKSLGKTLVAAIFLIPCLPGSAGAAVWKSADGVVSVEIPNPDKFSKVKPDPPASESWESTDGTLKFAIGEKETMQDANMIMSVLEQVFMRDINIHFKNGKLIESMIRQHEGYNFYVMTGQGELDGQTVYMTQALVKIGSKIYFAATLGKGGNTRLDTDAMAFIGTFKAVANNPAGRPVARGDEPQTTRISVLMGSIAVFLLVAAGILFVIIKLVTGRKANDERSRSRRRRYDRDRPRKRYEDDDEEDDEEDRPKRRSRAVEDEEDRPKKRRHEDEEEERPRKSRRRIDDDEEDDRPRRRNSDRD